MINLYNNTNLNYNPPFNIILNPNGNSGEMFIVTPDETCTLNISFDYLFKFDCADLLSYTRTGNNLLSLFESIGASVSLNLLTTNDKKVTSTSVYNETFFKPIGVGNMFNYLNNLNGASSGFFLCGEIGNDPTCHPLTIDNASSTTCSLVLPSIYTSLQNEYGSKITKSFNPLIISGLSSTWSKYSKDITDSAIINKIINKNINISVEVSGTVINTYVLLDNIVIKRNCTHISENDIFVSKSPGFNLKKVVDNKKSWVLNKNAEERAFNVPNITNLLTKRETDYTINNGSLVLNSKEIDLNLDISKAVETDVWTYIVNNPCILTGYNVDTKIVTKQVSTPIYSSGTIICSAQSVSVCISDGCGDKPININALTTQPLSLVKTVENFEAYVESELVDGKNRKIISSYPTLRLLYDRYINSLDYCGTKSNNFDYFKMINFTNLIGNYWVDLIEQVMPATTIWNSTKVYGNTIFDSQKFQYKPNTLFFGTASTYNQVLSPCTGVTCGVDVKTSVILSGSSNISEFLSPKTNNDFSNAYLIQYNSGSEFIGSVTKTVNFTCNIELSTNTTNALPNNTGGICNTILSSPNGAVNYSLSAKSSNSIIQSGQGVMVLPIFNNLSADTYTLTVTDIYGCHQNSTFVISYNPCVLTFTSVNTNSFKGMNNGFVTISNINDTGLVTGYTLTSGATTISAGTFNNQNNNQQLSLTIANLSAGTYSLTLTDNYGCNVTSGVTINENPCILSTTALSVPFTQFDDGTGTGSITLNVTNAYGIPSSIPAGNPQPTSIQSPNLGVSYTVSGITTNKTGTINDVNNHTEGNLSAGAYNVKFIDNSAIGCYSSTTLSIPKITYSGYAGYCEIATADFKLREFITGFSSPVLSYWFPTTKNGGKNRIYVLFNVNSNSTNTITSNIYYLDNSNDFIKSTTPYTPYFTSSDFKPIGTYNGNTVNNFYKNAIFDENNNNIYFCGENSINPNSGANSINPNNGGLDVYDIDTDTWVGTIPYGSNDTNDRQVLYSYSTNVNNKTIKFIVVNNSKIDRGGGAYGGGFTVYQANTIKPYLQNPTKNSLVSFDIVLDAGNNITYKDYFYNGSLYLGLFIKVGDYYWSCPGGSVNNAGILIFALEASDSANNIKPVNPADPALLPNQSKFINGKYWGSIFYDESYHKVYFSDFGSQTISVYDVTNGNNIGGGGKLLKEIDISKYNSGYNSDFSNLNYVPITYVTLDPIDNNTLYCTVQMNDPSDEETPRWSNTYVIDRDKSVFKRLIKGFYALNTSVVDDGYDTKSLMSVNNGEGTLSIYNNRYSGYTTGNYIYTSMMRYKNGTPDTSLSDKGILNKINQIDAYGTTATTVNTNIFEVTNQYKNKISAPKVISGACLTTSFASASTNTIANTTTQQSVNFQMQFDPTVYNNSKISNFVVSLYDASNGPIGSPSTGVTYSYSTVNYNGGYIDDILTSSTQYFTSNTVAYKIHLDYYSGSTITPSNKITGYTYNGPTNTKNP